MLPFRTVFIPGCDSSQRDEPHPSRCQADKRGKKRARGEKTQAILKVKVSKLSCHKLSKKKKTTKDKTTGRWKVQQPQTAAEISVNPGESQASGTDSDSAGGDVFFFSQRLTPKTTKEKEKAKLAVCATISRMLEENQLIRQRLIAVSQTH